MSGVSVVEPTALTDAMLTSSSAAEPGVGETVWAAATAYNLGQQAIRVSTHRKYERVVAGTTATAPELDEVNWLDIGPTNKLAMFDRKVGTITSVASPLTLVMRPGPVSGIGLLGLVGRQVDIVLKDAPGGTVVYSKTILLDGTEITSFFEWFFTDYEQLTELVLTDLPQQFASGELSVSITGTGNVECGVLQVGAVMEVGDAQYGSSVSIVDYSRKEVDAFGNIDVVERAFSKRIDLKVTTQKARFAKIFNFLTRVRATPCIYRCTDVPGYGPLTAYAFFRDVSIEITYPTEHLCTLAIEGLT